jgi:hypothetical protein
LNLEEAKVKVKKSKPSSQFLMLSDRQRAFIVTLAKELQKDTN